jgi:hypothetical protein
VHVVGSRVLFAVMLGHRIRTLGLDQAAGRSFNFQAYKGH